MKSILQHPDRAFWRFVLVHLAVWTLVPSLLNHNPPLDVIESVSWGHQWQWGYEKHPPLAAWLAELSYFIFPAQLWDHFLLSQLCVVLCFWAVWELGNELLKPTQALAAVLLLEGIYYYNFTSPEFNPNVVLLPLWILTALFFTRSIIHNRWEDWTWLGICAGVCIYAKYFSAFLLASMVLYVLFNGWQHLKTAKPYWAVALCLLIAAPHLCWMLEHNLTTIRYGLARTEGIEGWLAHLYYPARFTLVQAFALLPAILLFFFAAEKRMRKKLDDKTQLVLFLFLAPLFLTLVTSLVFGFRLKSMWGTPLLSLSGIVLVMLFSQKITTQQVRRFVMGWVVLLTLSVSAYTAQYFLEPLLKGKAKRTQFPGEQVATTLTEAWHERYGTKLPTVVGTQWLAGNVNFHSPDRPVVFVDGDPTKSPWITIEDLETHGGIVLWEGKEIPYDSPIPLEPQPNLTFEYHTITPIPPFTLGWAIVAPK